MSTGEPIGSQHPRFPGFDVVQQAPAWDDATRRVVLGRLETDETLRFFTESEFRVARAMLDQLVGQSHDRMVPIAHMVDARLAAGSTDGWHYDGMPSDSEVWRQSLHGLAEDANESHGVGFAELMDEEQRAILQRVQDLGDASWRGLPAGRLWNLWLRYACTAFYAHPSAWNEIGFAGPAYPRGYKNSHVGTREPFEVRDVMPQVDPARGGS
ncbi:gluconate 2-dehydrogenase subunit 3 family protein [Leifsonia sp. Root112D2]|uniref:gluconate 2-dehydrogenase subunit 3 family protein n=1 Tax=Leifsonia sp. Root112D2 TaxID=1736426 RepID=UPI00070071B9|nr:gluconate 2-dehydrogenase subunit 3 family protein [Leifsonia sp. Root112D2]KQV07359.1 hypothetical protein ASC63_08675 [Leifsonia sp. Root112D2]